MEENKQLYISENCVASFFVGELGWFIQRWSAYLRYLKFEKYPDHKFLLFSGIHLAPFVHDFIAYTISFPPEFSKLGLDADCYESPLEGSPPGSLTPPYVYKDIIAFCRQFYDVEKAIEVWPPRGANNWIDSKQQIFTRFSSTEKLDHDRPIICLFPRGRARSPNRNVPEYIWREVVSILSLQFLVVLGGTPEGSSLSDYKGDNVINLIEYNGDDKMEKIMSYLSHSRLAISSQSGLTHVGLACDTPSYIIGHEMLRHTERENRLQTPTSFREIKDYRAIDANTIVKDVYNFIEVLEKSGVPDKSNPTHIINRPALRTLHGKKDLVGAEIGVFNGLNSLNMLNNLDIKKLYLIDPYGNVDGKLDGTTTDSEEIQTIKAAGRERLKEFSDKIVWIEKHSWDAASEIEDGELDFVYIDGNHEYEAVKKDIELYYPKVKTDGLVAGHDYDAPEPNNGVIQAVNEFFGDKAVKIYSGLGADDRRSNDWWVKGHHPHLDFLRKEEDAFNKVLSGRV